MAYIVVNENMLKLLFSAAALIFLFRWVQGLYCLRWAQRLPLLRQPLAHRPRVSVVIAARDEEARVEQTLRHILVQEHIDVEVIPVSDRGRDRTDCILEQLAFEDCRVHPKRVDVLPERWLGKCYACHVGATNHLQTAWLAPARRRVFTPFVFIAVFYAVLNSMIVTLRQRGIRWRDTFYPLKMLRNGNLP